MLRDAMYQGFYVLDTLRYTLGLCPNLAVKNVSVCLEAAAAAQKFHKNLKLKISLTV
jgi:hypothetical protein